MSRHPCSELKITCRHHLGLWPGRAVSAQALDFDRHGMALQVSRPIAPGTHLLLSIDSGPVAVEAIDAVVHNCREWTEGFRCGVQFRVTDLIPDEAPLRVALCAIESRLAQRPAIQR